jgi:ATP-dependent Clp protease adaptor protein ClpS
LQKNQYFWPGFRPGHARAGIGPKQGQNLLFKAPNSTRQHQPALLICNMVETATPETLPVIIDEPKEGTDSSLDPGFLVICWNDPVNYMDYVTHVFQKVFGWSKSKAEFHMLQVHEQGKSVLIREQLEKAEHYVHQLQRYSLHATLERDQ